MSCVRGMNPPFSKHDVLSGLVISTNYSYLSDSDRNEWELICSLATVLSSIEKSIDLWLAARAQASHVFPRSRSPSHQATPCCHKCLPQTAMLEPIWRWRIGNICSLWFVSDPTAGMWRTKFCSPDPIGSCADPTVNVPQNTNVVSRILLDPARILLILKEACYRIATSWDPRASIYIIK